MNSLGEYINHFAVSYRDTTHEHLYAYFTDYSSSPMRFMVVDLSDKTSPAALWVVGDYYGEVMFPLFVQGLYAYTGHSLGFGVVDISDPANPSLIGVLPQCFPKDIWVAGSRAYTTTGYWFQTVDVSDPYNPYLVNTVGYSNGTQDIEVSGSYAYMVNGHFSSPGFLQIIDISNPSYPQRISRYYLEEGSLGLDVVDSLAFMVSGDGDGLRILNVKDPLHPHEISFCGGILGTPYDVVVSGSYAYITHPDYFNG
jgi:hypothetical protein